MFGPDTDLKDDIAPKEEEDNNNISSSSKKKINYYISNSITSYNSYICFNNFISFEF